MGFPEGLSKEALIKVKNESIAAAVEAVVTLQNEHGSQPEKNAPMAGKKPTVSQWNCEACTVINQPGGTECQVCGREAPAKAYVDEEAEKARKEAEEKERQEEEERLARERELEEEKKRQEELKRLEEETLQEKIR